MPLVLLPILVDTHAAGLSDAALAHTWQRSTRPALDALGQSPHVRAALHLSGPTLRWAARHDPGAIQLLGELVAKERVELLASGAEGPLLSLIPERDAVAQLRRHLRELQHHLGAKAQVLWPAAQAWDPCLGPILQKCGITATFADAGLVAQGALRPGPVDSWVRTVAAGAAVQLFPLDRHLGAAAVPSPVARVISHLEGLARDGRRLACMAVPLARLGDDPAQDRRGWWSGLLDGLKASKVRTVTPGRALAGVPDAGRAFPPAGTPPAVGLCARAGWRDEAADWRAWAGLDGEPPGPPIEALVAVEPAADRLLARTRRLSDQLAQARRDARKARQNIAPVDAATAALQRAQSAAPLLALPELGGQLADPQVRAAAWRAVDAALDAVPAPDGHHAALDLYADGQDELELQTPSLLVVLSPRRGGAVTELVLRGVGSFANGTERPPSPERAALAAAEPLPVLLSEASAPAPAPEPLGLDSLDEDDEPTDPGLGAAFPAPPPAPVVPAAARPHLRATDRHPRLLFQDRLLGAATTLESLQSGQYPEQGDFLGGAYRLERAERTDSGALEVVMVREGTVRQDPEPPGMIQVHKRLLFAVDSPTVTVSYEVVNRSREPVGSTLAVELHLGLDGRTDAARTLHVPGQPAVPVTASGDHAGVNDFALRCADLGLLLRLRPQRPARLLHHPVVRMLPVPGGLAARQQCTAVLLAWPLQLWGEERWQTELTLQFHRSERAR